MWFTEDAWSPIIICCVAGVICFIAWSSTQQSRYLVPIPLLLLGCVTLYFAERAVITDREKLEATLLDLTDTFVAESQIINGGNLPEAVRSVEFFSRTNTADRARVRAALALAHVEDDLRVTDVSVTLTNENTRALTHFRANGTINAGSFSGHHPSRWELTWQKEGGEWKITRTRMLEVVSGEERDIPRVD